MGLSVGVVTIKYLEEPRKPVRDFLFQIASDVSLGFDDEEYEEETQDDEPYTWGGGWGANTFVEFSRPYLDWKAERWATSQSIDSVARDTVRRWIADLPWTNETDMVMLHLNV